jgi:subtilisin family serine protease
VTPAIQQQLQATGLVQVIVVLRSAVPAAAALEAARPTGPTKGEREAVAAVAERLQHWFVAGPETRDGAIALHARAPGLESARARAPRVHVFENLGVLLGTVDRKGIANLERDREVVEVTAAPEFSLIRPVKRKAARAARGTTWGLERLRIPKLRQAEKLTGEGVLVGHLDTGVDGTHPAFGPKREAIAAFAEFDWMGQPVAHPKAHDPEGHGTHTAGTILGRKVGGMEFGVAPAARATDRRRPSVSARR